MADSNTDGRTKIWSVPSITNIAAPTTTELNAGTALESYLTPDGLLGFEPDTEAVDNSKMNSTYKTETPGRTAFSGTGLRFVKQTGTDTIYNTMVKDYATHIVIRRDSTSSTAWAAADKVEVYPVTCGETKNLNPAPNEVHKYETPLFVTSTPSLRATVA